MRKGSFCSLTILLTLFLLPTVSPGQEAFDFYGLEFGMTQEEARVLFPQLNNNLVENPGHGMSSLELYFDREDLLMEIQASYGRPEDPLEKIGLQRALREKFFMQIRQNFPEISVTIDEFGNQAVFKLVLLSTSIRERNIEYYKGEFLENLQ